MNGGSQLAITLMMMIGLGALVSGILLYINPFWKPNLIYEQELVKRNAMVWIISGATILITNIVLLLFVVVLGPYFDVMIPFKGFSATASYSRYTPQEDSCMDIET